MSSVIGTDRRTSLDDAPPARAEARGLSRRDLLKGLVGAAGIAAAPGLVAACGGGVSPSIAQQITPASPSAAVPPPSPGRMVTLATFYPSGKRITDAFTSLTGITVKANTVDAAGFQDRIIPYLKGSPEDVISWGAARTRSLAAQGLATSIDDVWAKVESRFPPAVKQSATAVDTRQYFMPVAAYAWALFYRTTLFADNGYEVPSTWPEFKSLANRMQRDGLIPIAMGDAEVFEADGTFDILDLRQNGLRFHLDLMTGKEKWTDRRVKDVFDRWREILPFTQTGGAARSWQDAAQALVDKRAGMYLMGSGIMLGQVSVADLDIFPFPSLGTRWDVERSFDMPTEGFMVTRNSPTLDTDLDNARAFMEFLASSSAQSMFAAEEPGSIALVKDADTSGYNRVQKKVQAMVDAARGVSEFLDRDTDPGFAYQFGFALQDFLLHPQQDLDAMLSAIQRHWDER
jgi:multiple sugar transport system substrate-binding protein